MTTRDAIRDKMIQAGAELRRLREEADITQQEMEKRTADRYGDQNRVYAQQVSRIEKGQVDKPPIIDLLRIGGILGLSPDDIAEMYDLWPRQQKRQQLDSRLQAAIDLAEELPPEAREAFLSWVQFATLQARAEQRKHTTASAAATTDHRGRGPHRTGEEPAGLHTRS